MDEKRRDLILHKRVRRIADEHGCSVADVNAVLDHHPIETNRDEYLRRALALELLHLDELEEAFRDKALVDRDVASGVLLVKVSERRSALLGLNAPTGHAVRVVQHASANAPTGTDKLEAAIEALIQDQRRNGDGSSQH
jgi:DNA-binding transcriptional MerR regulator